MTAPEIGGEGYGLMLRARFVWMFRSKGHSATIIIFREREPEEYRLSLNWAFLGVVIEKLKPQFSTQGLTLALDYVLSGDSNTILAPHWTTLTVTIKPVGLQCGNCCDVEYRRTIFTYGKLTSSIHC